MTNCQGSTGIWSPVIDPFLIDILVAGLGGRKLLLVGVGFHELASSCVGNFFLRQQGDVFMYIDPKTLPAPASKENPAWNKDFLSNWNLQLESPVAHCQDLAAYNSYLLLSFHNIRLAFPRTSPINVLITNAHEALFILFLTPYICRL